MVVDHSDRNIDTTFWANFFKSAFLLVPGEQRGGGLSFWVLEKVLESPGIIQRVGESQSLSSLGKLPSSSLSKQQECSVIFICFGFASVTLKLQDTFPLRIVKKLN